MAVSAAVNAGATISNQTEPLSERLKRGWRLFNCNFITVPRNDNIALYESILEVVSAHCRQLCKSGEERHFTLMSRTDEKHTHVNMLPDPNATLSLYMKGVEGHVEITNRNLSPSPLLAASYQFELRAHRNHQHCWNHFILYVLGQMRPPLPDDEFKVYQETFGNVTPPPPSVSAAANHTDPFASSSSSDCKIRCIIL